MKKRLFALFICFFSLQIFAQSINDSQIIEESSPVYDLFSQLEYTTKTFSFTAAKPLSVRELKFYLNQYEYDDLSEESKIIYEKISDLIVEKENLIPTVLSTINKLKGNPDFQEKEPKNAVENENIADTSSDNDLTANFHVTFTPEVYYKTNDKIDYSFNYYLKNPIITGLINVGFGDLFALGTEMFLSKNWISIHQPEKADMKDNYCNIPLNFQKITSVKAVEFNFPKFAYGSFGKDYEKWGYNFQIGKQGKTIGNTISGSIIYNSTFETDCFTEFDIYSKAFRYSLDVIQISSNRMDGFQGTATERYMYLHHMDFRPFKNFTFSYIEGSMTVNPFSLRYLNPFTIMHQFGGWENYRTDENKSIYKETNFSAYLGLILDYIPIRNLRLYVMYAMNEWQQPWERSDSWGKYYPDSYGYQFGTEYLHYFNNSSNLKLGLEGVYSLPYLYIKQTPSSSLYRFRTDMQTKENVYSWIGSPFGPDCIAGIFRAVYSWDNKLTFEFNYTLAAKGEIDFNIFNNYVEKNGTKYYNYYPSVIYKLKKDKLKDEITVSDEELFDMAMSKKPSGVPVYSNSIKLRADYNFTKQICVTGQTVFVYEINSNHLLDNKQFGTEFGLSFSYKIY
ncbi:MAG: hypothetical protein MJ188_01890 [Treponema sp.]|nr:hypothetical protein [Treponema sp.]